MEPRLHFYSEHTDEDSVTFAIDNTDGRFYRPKRGKFVAVSVAEDKAVDSNNRTFECTFHLNETQVGQLRAWLDAHFPKA